MTRSEMLEHELARLERLAEGCSLHTAEWQAVAATLRQLLPDESSSRDRQAAAESSEWASAAAKRQRVDKLERRLREIAELQSPTTDLADLAA